MGVTTANTQTITWSQLKSQLTAFDTELRQALEGLHLADTVYSLQIDHACVRLSTKDQVDWLLGELANHGRTISTATIAGRPIHIIQLHEPIEILGQKVFGLEVPYPKPDHEHKDGWEHIEFVLPEGTDNTKPGIETAFFKLFPRLKTSAWQRMAGLKFSEPGAEADQLPNVTISMRRHGIGIKFHALPIQKVVGYE